MSSGARPAGAAPLPGPRQPAKSSQLAQLVAGAAVGGLGTLAAYRLFRPVLRDAPIREAIGALGGWAPAAGVAAFVAAWFLSVAAHEAGHVLGGVVARFRFFFYIVGPLRVERDIFSGALRVRRNESWAQAGGMAASFPTDARDLPRRLFFFIFGGPFASLLLGAGALAAARAVPAHDAPYARLALGVLAVTSLLIFVVTMIPIYQGTIATDGARLLQLARGELTAARHAAVMPLMGLITSGVAPRDLPRELVERALLDPDGTPEECHANLIAFTHFLDGGDVARAGAALDRVMTQRETLGPIVLPSILAEEAYFAARHRAQPARARELLGQIPTSAVGVQPYDRLRIEAAIALAEGQPADARRLAEQALAATPPRDAFSRGQLEGMVRAAEAGSR